VLRLVKGREWLPARYPYDPAMGSRSSGQTITRPIRLP
jgi:hypothetical protein